MAKRLVAKTGEYQKDGQTKGEYTRIGVMLENDKGEYMLLDPCVDLAGVLMKQRILNPQKSGDMVMVSVFSDDYSGQNSQPSQPQGQNLPPSDFDDASIPF